MSDDPVVVWGGTGERPEYRQHGGRAKVGKCVVEGCDRWRGTNPTLCDLHEDRERRGMPLTAEHDAVGVRPSGYGTYGVVIATDTAVLCYECGGWFRMITAGHLRSKHGGMTQDEYRDRHGLPRRVGLCCGEYAQAHRDKVDRMEAEIGFLTAAREMITEAEAIANARPRRPTSPAGKAARAAGLRRASQERAAVRVCRECGAPIPEGLQWRKTTYCSAVCAAQPKRRAQLRRSAVRAGEPVDFVRGEGSGARLTAEAVAYRLGVTAGALEYRLRVGRLPAHDGRTGGEPWWWESTIERVEEP